MKRITIVMRHGSEPILADDIPDVIATSLATQFMIGFKGRLRLSDESSGSDRMIDMGDVVGLEIEDAGSSALPED